MKLTVSFRHLVPVLLVTGLALIIISVGWSLWQTKSSISALRKINVQQAALHAQKAKPIAAAFSMTAGWLLPDLNVWSQTLNLIAAAPTTSQAIIAANSQSLLGTSSLNIENSEYHQQLTQLLQDLSDLEAALHKSIFIKRAFPEETKLLSKVNQESQIISKNLLTNEKTILVVFQNSEELRATGGFMGSYAVVKLNNGQLKEIQVLDIYVPDGQFQGFVTPPPGVKEYLSSGTGLRLPDANWWPDFPSSATRILPFMGLGQNQAVDGVVAVNLDVVERILQVTGPIYLPDYQTSVTSENFAEVARSDRDEFFPGSIAKAQFLSHFMTQLKLELSQLSPDQYKEVALVVKSSLTGKDIQLYSNQPALQDLIAQYSFGGELKTPASSFYLMSVEANVGINKANRQVLRQVKIDLAENESQIKIEFTNNNPLTPITAINPIPNAAPHLHYVNYQRLLLNPSTQIKEIIFADNQIETWDEELITTSNGQQLKQVGFLVEVPEQTTKTLSVTFSHLPLSTFDSVTIQKQSGIPSTPYEITSPTDRTTTLLEQDLTLTWDNF